MKSFIVAVLFLTAAGCASGPDMMKLPNPSGAEAPKRGTEPQSEQRIDLIGLQTDLKMNVGLDDLGYHEKSFNTCEAGHGFSHSSNCHVEHFVLIQFQLLCRPTESDGFRELTAADTTAIGNRSVDWLLQGHRGQVQTDEGGYAVIRGSFPASPKARHIKLNLGRKFLHMEAGDVARIVTPPEWCLR